MNTKEKKMILYGIILGILLLFIYLFLGNLSYTNGYEEGLNIQYSNKEKWYCLGVQEGILSAMEYHIKQLEDNNCKIIDGVKQYKGEECDKMWRDYLYFKDLNAKKKALHRGCE